MRSHLFFVDRLGRVLVSNDSICDIRVPLLFHLCSRHPFLDSTSDGARPLGHLNVHRGLPPVLIRHAPRFEEQAHLLLRTLLGSIGRLSGHLIMQGIDAHNSHAKCQTALLGFGTHCNYLIRRLLALRDRN